MNSTVSARRHALKMLFAGLVATVGTGCGIAQQLPTGQSSSTDGEPLSLEVRDALRNHPSTAQLRVRISSAGDEIVIKGFVPDKNDVYNIEQVANSVPGVRHVLMDVYVQ